MHCQGREWWARAAGSSRATWQQWQTHAGQAEDSEQSGRRTTRARSPGTLGMTASGASSCLLRLRIDRVIGSRITPHAAFAARPRIPVAHRSCWAFWNFPARLGVPAWIADRLVPHWCGSRLEASARVQNGRLAAQGGGLVPVLAKDRCRSFQALDCLGSLGLRGVSGRRRSSAA